MTNGMFTAKISRHDTASTNHPPASGPMTVAIPDHAVHEPIAPPRSSRGNASTITASELGISSAPNAPWSARHAIRKPMLGAIAHSSETTPNPPDPDREHAPLAEQVAEGSADQDQRPEREQVGVRYPLLAGEAAAEVRADRRKRHVDGGRVEPGHE